MIKKQYNLATCLTGIAVFVAAAILYFSFIGYDFSQVFRTESTQSILERSNAYLRGNDFNRAITLLNESIIVNPDNADLYNNLCVAYGMKKNYTEAVSACVNAVRIAPDYQLAKNNLAWVEHEKEAQKR